MNRTKKPAKQIGKLVALATRIENGALAGSELPKRLKLLNWGENEFIGEDGKTHIIKVGEGTVSALSANQDKLGFDRIALDFDHNSLVGHPNFQKDPREVAGYGIALAIQGEGLFLDQIEYTPAGKKFAPNYIDLSPTPRPNAQGEVDFLHSVALCPQGRVKGLSFFSINSNDQSQDNDTMDYKKLILTMLGLAEDASDADIEAASKKFAEKESAEDPKEKGTGEASDEVKAMSAEMKEIKKTLLALSKTGEDQKRAALLDQAAREGKLVPMSVKKLPIENLEEVLKELPAGQVPVDQRTPENVIALSTSAALPETAEASVMRQLGISEDDWKKHKTA